MRKQHAQLSSLAEAETANAVTASQKVADAVRDQVSAGQLVPGVRLTEEVVAGHLNVSRNTVREALAMLAAEGILERRPHRGVFVVEPSREMVIDLYRYRMLTECAAVTWGDKIQRKQLIAMRSIVKDAEVAVEEGDWERVSNDNQFFHAQIVDLAGSQWLNRSFRSALAVMRLSFQGTPSAEWQKPYVALNLQVLRKLEANKRHEAAADLQEYLIRARDELLEAMRAKGKG